jgi:hypothetical protein
MKGEEEAKKKESYAVMCEGKPASWSTFANVQERREDSEAPRRASEPRRLLHMNVKHVQANHLQKYPERYLIRVFIRYHEMVN